MKLHYALHSQCVDVYVCMYVCLCMCARGIMHTHIALSLPLNHNAKYTTYHSLLLVNTMYHQLSPFSQLFGHFMASLYIHLYHQIYICLYKHLIRLL